MEYCTFEFAERMAHLKIANAISDLQMKHSNMKDFVFPVIVWKSLGINKAGLYTSYSNTITLNTNYLYSKDWDIFLERTPLHELAHAIVWQVYKMRGHNRVWKNVCNLLGISNSRCHSYSTPEIENSRKRKRYNAHCSCRSHVITSVKYNRIIRGTNYICTKCHEKLILDD